MPSSLDLLERFQRTAMTWNSSWGSAEEEGHCRFWGCVWEDGLGIDMRWECHTSNSMNNGNSQANISRLSVWGVGGGVCVLSHIQLFANPWIVALCLWYFPGKNTGMGCHFLFQGVFPTQRLNLHLLHWQIYHWATWLPLCYRTCIISSLKDNSLPTYYGVTMLDSQDLVNLLVRQISGSYLLHVCRISFWILSDSFGFWPLNSLDFFFFFWRLLRFLFPLYVQCFWKICTSWTPVKNYF